MIYVGNSNKNSIFTGSKAPEIFSGGVKIYPTKQEIVLFNGQTGEGQINTSLYGGFINNETSYGSSITYTNDSIILRSVGENTSGTYQPSMGSVKQIDFTDVDKVIVNVKHVWKSHPSYYQNVVINRSRNAYHALAGIHLTEGQVYLDTSNIDGLYYLVFSGYTDQNIMTTIDYISLLKKM